MNNGIYICYRRTAARYIPQAVYQHLHRAGIECFLDVDSADDNTATRYIDSYPYFLLIASPNIFTECEKPEDPLRAELVQALATYRRIILLSTQPGTFEAEVETIRKLGEPFAALLDAPRAPMLADIPTTVQRLQAQFLTSVEEDQPKITLSEDDQKARVEKIQRAQALPQITENQILAQACYERTETGEISELSRKIQYLNKAIQLEPQFWQAWFVRGMNKFGLKDYQGALSDITQVQVLKPDEAFTYLMQATASFHAGNYQNALDGFSKALELTPEAGELLRVLRASTYMKLNQYKAAILEYNEAMKIKPNSLMALTGRGVARFHFGDYLGTITDCTKAIKLDAENFEAYRWRAMAYANENLSDNALADATQAITLAPQAWSAYMLRGAIYQRSRDRRAALRDYGRALDLLPDTPENAEARKTVIRLGRSADAPFASLLTDVTALLQRFNI